MIGHGVSHNKILEKLPTSFLRNGTPSGQVGRGGMSQNHPRTLHVIGCDFQPAHLKRTIALKFIPREETGTPTSHGDKPSVGQILTHLNLTLETRNSKLTTQNAKLLACPPEADPPSAEN